VRAVAVHPDVIVAISRVWRTTCTLVRSGEEGFVIDSPVYPDELAALPAVLEQVQFPLCGLLVTHADWDHLLARTAFPDASLGMGEASAARLSSEPDDAQRGLRRFDEEHYVAERPPLVLDGIQTLPVPGRISVGEQNELELYPLPGHTADGTAFWIPWARVLVCGDYLSPVEIPMISDQGSVDAYMGSIEQLKALVARAETVVPGHGYPLPRNEAEAVLNEDRAYLEALVADGAGASLPASRRTEAQQAIHQRNAAKLDVR
jgi:glyoxylase-like metal-dependent hydrolase (beta-lactamase superfamily II)